MFTLSIAVGEARPAAGEQQSVSGPSSLQTARRLRQVCHQLLLSRQNSTELSLLRRGNSEDWRTVRWSLVDEESSQGTFVNQTRLERGEPVILNADDLIGIGSADLASSRQGGKETFVYKLKPPEAFMDLVSVI